MKIIPITQWSASKIKTFEQCKFRAQLMYGHKIKEPERPLPPGKKEQPNDRGSRIHLSAEHYVMGKQGVLIPELFEFEHEFNSLRQHYKAGKVSLEGEWAHDKNWEPVEWRSNKAWLRLKLDALYFVSKREAVVIDYKTGRKFGNEVSHAQQTQLYQLSAFLRYPALEVIHNELWYLDQKGNDRLTQVTFTRSQGLRFRHGFTKKGLAMTECIEFPANPNIFNCKWCGYGSWGTGHCTVGVRG